ncbi:E3 ubiquitin-protein ligase [Vairimorpha necatrix]|uniref:HECT-type E3 ubiquitin transferase n=1 Tax=Vairimorpha necatrix TaxID=6039 RepID=A0AAX4JDH5_9MICR
MIFWGKNNYIVLIYLSCYFCSLEDNVDMDIEMAHADNNMDVESSNEDIVQLTEAAYEDEIARFKEELKIYFNKLTKSNDTVIIYCRRETIFYSAIAYLFVLEKVELLKYNYSVKFIDEIGQDGGGLSKEYFTLFIQEIFKPERKLFYSPSGDTSGIIPMKYCSGTNPQIRNLAYKTLGIIMALMLRKSIIADVRFDPIVWKKILEIDITTEDFENIDKNYYRNLMSLKENKDLLEDSELTFVDEDGIELKTDGKNIVVDETNVDEYIDTLLKHKYSKNISEECDLIKEGLHKVIPKDMLLGKLSQSSFQKLICGESFIDIEDWKANTKYTDESYVSGGEKFTEDSQEIIWFWNVMESLTQEERSKVLYYVTGSRKPPVGGFKNLCIGNRKELFNILPDGKEKIDKLPWARTCMNRLYLSNFSSEEVLRKNLLIALEWPEKEFDIA